LGLLHGLHSSNVYFNETKESGMIYVTFKEAVDVTENYNGMARSFLTVIAIMTSELTMNLSKSVTITTVTMVWG
jgi:hypothetical protein